MGRMAPSLGFTGCLTLLSFLVGSRAGLVIEGPGGLQLLLLPPPLTRGQRVAVMTFLKLHLQAGQVLLDPIEVHAQLLPLDLGLLGGHILYGERNRVEANPWVPTGWEEDRDPYVPALGCPASFCLSAG